MELVNLSSCATALADRTIDNDRPLLAESLISAEKAGTYGCLLSIAMMSEEGQVSRVFLLTSCVKSELSRISSRAAKRRNDRSYMLLWESAQEETFSFFSAMLVSAVLTATAFSQSALTYRGLHATAFYVVGLHGATVHMSEPLN